MAQGMQSPEFEALLEKVMGPFLRPMLDVLVNSLEDVESKILNAPRTYRRKLVRDLENAGKKITIDADPEEYGRSIMALLHEMLLRGPDMLQQSARRGLADFRSRFLTLPEYHVFNALANDAEAIAPKEFEAAFKKIDQDLTAQKLALAGILLAHASKLEGELRAEYAIHAAKRASELLYQPFVRTLLRLFCAVEKKKPLDFYGIKYGQALNILRDWHFPKKYPNLLDLDAVMLRNAEAHEHWDYFFETDEVEVWDQNTEKRKQFTVDKLLQRAHNMANIAGAMFPGYIRARYFMIFDKLADPLREVLSDLVGSDSKLRDAALLNLQQKIP